MEKHIHGGDLTFYEHCLDFSASNNPLGTPPFVLAAAQESLQDIRSYPQPDARKLRKAISRLEGLDAKYVVCSGGATSILFNLARALHPKETLLTAPAFAEYERAVRSVGSKVSFFKREEEANFVLGEDYLEALHMNVDMAFLCNPNNPDGSLIDPDLLKEILDKCAKMNIRLVLDECYLDLSTGGEGRSLVPLLKDYPNLFILKGLTKTYGLAGLRVGYGLCRDGELLEQLEDVSVPWEISTPGQAAALAAVEDNGAFVEEGRAIVEQERPFLMEMFEELEWKAYPSQANFILFQGPAGLFQECARRGILVRDCYNMRSLEHGYFRIGIRTHEDNEKLRDVLFEIKRRER